VLKVFVALLSTVVLAVGPAAYAAAPPSVVPNVTPPPDPGDTYASVRGATHVCNEHNICQGTFSGNAQLTGWVRATLHVNVNLYADGTRLATKSNTCFASTSCSVTEGPVSFNYVYPHNPQVCVTATGQASYSGGSAVGSDQACVYLGGGGGAIAER
jgi:hypothetical protein